MVLFGDKPDDTRPVFLDLTKIALPRTALVSILHRVSGICLILSLPLLAGLLYCLVHPYFSDAFIASIAQHILFQVYIFLVIIGVGYHWLAGLRHLLADVFGLYALGVARFTADTVLFLWLLWVFFCVYRIWF